MQRLLADKLILWKDGLDRKPLLLLGIKHSGKTFLLKDFGNKYYKNVIYLDFCKDKLLADIINQNPDPYILLKNLSIYLEKDITAENTLIIFDEIHLCLGALESLRFFYEIAPEYHIAAISSYINVALPQGTAVPVDKIELLTLYPMNFYEFLLAQSPMLANHLRDSGFKSGVYSTFQKQLADKFFDFQIVGGFPLVVQSWINDRSFETVDKLLTDIIKSIESDITALCGKVLLPKILAVFSAVSGQLLKNNRKFMFSKVNKNWRGKDLDDAVYWLIRAGLVYKVLHIDEPGIPISGHINPTHFKLYMCDIGMLRRKGSIPTQAIMSLDNSGATVKSVISENIVCCELIRLYERELYYWSAENPGRAEIEFIVQSQGELIPIEVKPGSANKARSLQQYRLKYNPNKSVLTGTDTDNEDILPIYGFWNLPEWLTGK